MANGKDDKAARERAEIIGDTDRNRQVINEFRSNRGVVGGEFAGAPLLLLTTIGRKSNTPRTAPLVYLREDSRLVVFASAAGSEHHPSWYLNLQNRPRAMVELGTEVFEVSSTELKGSERREVFDKQIAARPDFGAYELATKREIPVIALSSL